MAKNTQSAKANPKANSIGQVISVRQLVSFASRKKNVLLSGLHGVGKTSLILETFERQYGKRGVDWIYLNGATLDPWLDLIGCPKSVVNDAKQEVMRVIPPEQMPTTIRAIYIDELNRAPKEVRNAVMELLQFRSMNGRKFPNLEVIWSSVNPAQDDQYDVEMLDPAQEDRFPIQISIPYDVDKEYFTGKYGEEIAKVACDWWRALTQEHRLLVSPRRLDEAVTGHIEGDDLRFYLSDKLKTSDLETNLKTASESIVFMGMINKFSPAEIAGYMTVDRMQEKSRFMNGNIKYFKEKILPHLSEKVMEEIIAAGTFPQKVREAIADSGRLTPAKISSPQPIQQMSEGGRITDIQNIMKDGSVKPVTKKEPEPFLDAVADAYPHVARQANLDNVTFKGMANFEESRNPLYQAMRNWDAQTGQFNTILEKAVYVLMFIRTNHGKSGIARIFATIGECKTYEFSTFINKAIDVERNIRFILEIMAVCLIIRALAQSYEQNRGARTSKQASAYFNCGGMQLITGAFGKLLRSNDIRPILVAASGEDVIKSVHEGYLLAGGKNRNNMDSSECLLRCLINNLTSTFSAEQYGV